MSIGTRTSTPWRSVQIAVWPSGVMLWIWTRRVVKPEPRVFLLVGCLGSATLLPGAVPREV